MNNYNYIIVQESSAEIKAIARNILKNNWQRMLICSLLFTVLSGSLPLILGNSFKMFQVTQYIEGYGPYTYSFLPSIYDFFLMGAFTLGFAFLVLNFVRTGNTRVGLMFKGFEHYPKAFLLMLIMSIFVIFWMWLFIIPGFIAIYRYSQAFYILADDPSKGVMQCIRESKEMMLGNKGKLFFVHLSFFGWAVLISLIATFVASAIPFFASGIGFHILLTVLGLFLSVYLSITVAIFYELASGHLMKKETFVNTNNPFGENGSSNGF